MGDWKKDNGGTADMAVEIAKGTNTTSYLSSTLINFILVAVWFTIRKAFNTGMMAAARGVNDIGLSTLIMLGGVGTGTGFHLDWTEAYNIAFSIGAAAVAADTVLAVWVFINPLCVGEADAWIKETIKTSKRKHSQSTQVSRWPAGFASSAEDRVHLKGVDLERFLEYMHSLATPNPVVVLEQKPGQLVHVPSGWVHQVINMSPNVKVAWDYYDASNMHKYVELQHKLASRYFKGSMAGDYMSFNMIMSVLVGNM